MRQVLDLESYTICLNSREAAIISSTSQVVQPSNLLNLSDINEAVDATWCGLRFSQFVDP